MLVFFAYPVATIVGRGLAPDGHLELAPLSRVFTENADPVTDPYTMTPERIGANRDEWIREWTGTVLR